MYATATTHLPHPVGAVAGAVLADRIRTTDWFPELRRLDDRRLDEPGARSELLLGLPGWPARIAVTTEEVVRTTLTARGRTGDGRDVCVRFSLSPWDGGTAVVLSIDAGDDPRPLLSWSLTRRLETALVRLAGELATAVSAVGPVRP